MEIRVCEVFSMGGIESIETRYHHLESEGVREKKRTED
jgi:hypothetical protein